MAPLALISVKSPSMWVRTAKKCPTGTVRTVAPGANMSHQTAVYYNQGIINKNIPFLISNAYVETGEAFLPQLKKARLDPNYPISQGVRPFRKGNVRVERELRPVVGESIVKHSRIIHSYGHGGAGWSLSFGCAADILTMVEEALLDKAPTPMATVAKGLRESYVERFTARL